MVYPKKGVFHFWSTKTGTVFFLCLKKQVIFLGLKEKSPFEKSYQLPASIQPSYSHLDRCAEMLSLFLAPKWDVDDDFVLWSPWARARSQGQHRFCRKGPWAHSWMERRPGRTTDCYRFVVCSRFGPVERTAKWHREPLLGSCFGPPTPHQGICDPDSLCRKVPGSVTSEAGLQTVKSLECHETSTGESQGLAQPKCDQTVPIQPLVELHEAEFQKPKKTPWSSRNGMWKIENHWEWDDGLGGNNFSLRWIFGLRVDPYFWGVGYLFLLVVS